MKIAGLILLVTSPLLVATTAIWGNQGHFFDYKETGGWEIVKIYTGATAATCIGLYALSNKRGYSKNA